MRVVHDAYDVVIYHFKSSDRFRPPLVPTLAQRDDCQLAIHLCHCQPPRYRQAFIVPEVRRFVDGTGKATNNDYLVTAVPQTTGATGQRGFNLTASGTIFQDPAGGAAGTIPIN